MLERQNGDGSISGLREKDSLEMYRSGGYAGPAGGTAANGSGAIPSYPGGINITFNIQGGTDTAGGLLQWQNNLGYDIIVTGHILDVTTVATAACTASFGSAAASNTLATNMINGQDVHAATGTFNGGALSVKVANTTWLTGSKGGGTSAGLVGRVTVMAIQSNPTVGGP